MVTTYSLNRTSGPAVEPVSRAEAKKQCELASGVTTHDAAIDDWIIAAREQLEDDTGYACITTTFTLSMSAFPSGNAPIRLPVRPVQSVSSITYYDTADAQQTLATTVYGLDGPRRLVYVKNDQEWPSVNGQHDGIVVTFVAGYGSSASNVPRLLRQAVLLQVAKWFQHRGDESQMPAHDTAYERIVKRLLRSSYP